MKKLTVLAVLAALAVFPAFGNTSGDLELTGNITPFLSMKPKSGWIC